MCTAITLQTGDHYFGRTLDYDRTWGEEVTVTPRHFPLAFRHYPPLPDHYAMIGMAHVADGYPLYYDGVNEKGLAMAGLNFVGNARYLPPVQGKSNVAQFEAIPFLLGQCATLEEAKDMLAGMNLTDTPFSDRLPAAQLHWIIADRTGAVSLESTVHGIRVHENPAGVLTNNPPFDQQMWNLSNYLNLSAAEPENRFSDRIRLDPCSRGMGAMGLPGDLSSPSRFIRAAFTRLNSVSGPGEEESVSQFFHILDAVSQVRGCCRLGRDVFEITQYASCCNTSRGIYYYTTYENRRISCVEMGREDLESAELIRYPLNRQPGVFRHN